MKTSDAGRQFIEEWEGLILQAYDDATDRIVAPGQPIHGTLTIGYGHTTAAGPPKVSVGQKITRAQADEILAHDLAAVEQQVEKVVDVALTQNQFDALVSFQFNTGALARSSLLKAVNAKAAQHVIEGHFLEWVHAHGVLVRGLVNRRHAEMALFFTPDRNPKPAGDTPVAKGHTMGDTAGEITDALSKINQLAQSFGMFLKFIPGLGQYVGLIQAVLPKLLEAAQAVEKEVHQPVTSRAVIQRVVDHVDPQKPADAALSA